MQIDLPPELEVFIAEKVHSGEYVSASAVVTEALEALRGIDEEDKAKLEWLRREIAIGIDEADRGEFVEFDAEDVKAEGRRLGPLP